MKEIWKDIINFEGYYQCSNFGNIRSLDREINTKGGTKRISKGKILKPKTNPFYYCVGLSKFNKCKTYYIHRLVASSFISNSNNLPEINHIDGNKLNNNITNLEWITSSKNKYHAFEIGVSKKGKDNNLAKFSKEIIENVKKDLSKKIYTQRQIAHKYEMSYAQVSRIKTNKTRKYLGNE